MWNWPKMVKLFVKVQDEENSPYFLRLLRFVSRILWFLLFPLFNAYLTELHIFRARDRCCNKNVCHPICTHTHTHSLSLTQEWAFSMLLKGVFLSMRLKRQWQLIVIRQGVISTSGSVYTSLCKGQFKVPIETQKV